MTPSQKTMLKKKREQMRKRLRYDIAALIKLSEGELGEFEATHAIVDSILEGLNEKLRYGQIKPTLELGIAQTYLEHTKHQAGQAGDTEPAPAKPGVGSVWNKLLGKPIYQDSPVFIDDLPSNVPYPTGPETVTAKITKNVGDWYPKTTYDFVVGGEIGKITLDQYGYELPEGYDFVGPNAWGSYVVTKLTPEPADVPEKQVVHLCGTKGCEQFTVYQGSPYLLSGSMCHAKGLTLANINATLSGLQGGHLKATKIESKDAIEVGFKVDLDAHLANYNTQKAADFAKTYGFKTTNYFQQATGIKKEQLEAAYAKVQAGTFNKPEPATDGLGEPWGKEGPSNYPLKNSSGEVTHVPFKKWLTMDHLHALGMASVALPPGLMWHSHYPAGEKKWDVNAGLWWLDYMSSPKPAPPITPLTAKLPEWSWDYGDQVQEFGDTF